MQLCDRKCGPCHGDTPPLEKEEAEAYLTQTPKWSLEDNYIERNFKFKNFKKAVDFVNNVADTAEEEGHHPDIFLHSWNKVKITLKTNAINGLSVNDFILAAKIDKIFGK